MGQGDGGGAAYRVSGGARRGVSGVGMPVLMESHAYSIGISWDIMPIASEYQGISCL